MTYEDGYRAACDEMYAAIERFDAMAHGPWSRPYDDAGAAYDVALSNMQATIMAMRDKTVPMGKRGAFGFRAGAEAMREAAAEVCKKRGEDRDNTPADCEAAIRAIPLPEPPK